MMNIRSLPRIGHRVVVARMGSHHVTTNIGYWYKDKKIFFIPKFRLIELKWWKRESDYEILKYNLQDRTYHKCSMYADSKNAAKEVIASRLALSGEKWLEEVESVNGSLQIKIKKIYYEESGL